MATKPVGPVIAALIAADAPSVAVVGARVSSVGGTLQDETLPRVEYEVTENDEETDLNQSADACFASALVRVIAETYDGAVAALNLVRTALNNKGTYAGTTYAGVSVRKTRAASISDEPARPADDDEATVFEGVIEFEVKYT